MSKYSRQQEARMEKYFENHPDVELLKYYGSRVKNAGDFLIRIGKHQVRVDHKSFVSGIKVGIQKDWLINLTAYGLSRMDQEGASTPVITISSKHHRTVWALTTKHCPDLFVADTKYIKGGKKSTSINTGWLYDLGNDIGRIDCDGYQAYIMTLDNFIKEINNV